MSPKLRVAVSEFQWLAAVAASNQTGECPRGKASRRQQVDPQKTHIFRLDERSSFLSLSFSKTPEDRAQIWIECVAFNPSRIGITLAPKTKKAKFESFMHCQIAAIDIRKKGKSIFLPSLTKTRIIPTYPFQILGWSCQFSPVVFFVHLQKSRCLRFRLGSTCHLHQGESWPASLKAGRKRCLEDDPRTCKWLVSPICKYPFGRGGITPFRGLTVTITMVINHLRVRKMILQVEYRLLFSLRFAKVWGGLQNPLEDPKSVVGIFRYTGRDSYSWFLLKMGYSIAMLDYQRVYAPTSAGFDLQGALKSLKVDRSVEPVSQEHFFPTKKKWCNILGLKRRGKRGRPGENPKQKKRWKHFIHGGFCSWWMDCEEPRCLGICFVAGALPTRCRCGQETLGGSEFFSTPLL